MSEREIEHLPISLTKESFLTSLVRELSGSLEEIVGLEEAKGFISLVGHRLGRQINQVYRDAFGSPRLTREQVADVLVDFKRRIGGDFYLIEQDDSKIVLGNRRCPFDSKVHGRLSMCMMTSNVFGVIAAENLGYAKVELQSTFASGDEACRVVVYLDSMETENVEGHEYFGVETEFEELFENEENRYFRIEAEK